MQKHYYGNSENGRGTLTIALLQSLRSFSVTLPWQICREAASMAMEKEVIDLCDSSCDNEDDTNYDKSLKTCGNKEIESNSAVPQDFATNAKRPAVVISLITDDDDSCPNASSSNKRQKTEQSNGTPLVFLRTEGGDDGVVTEGIFDALRLVSQQQSRTIRTCCGVLHETSKSAPQGIPNQRNNQQSLTLLHIQQKDKWSCGYRNLQMLLAALVPTLPQNHLYFQGQGSKVSIDDSFERRVTCYEVPSRLELQGELEASWQAGYDENGSKHYKGSARGKCQWIGAVEVWSILVAAGFDACVIQFIRCPESRGLLGPFCSRYFATACPWWCRTQSSFSSTTPSQNLAHQLLQPANDHPSKSIHDCGCARLPLYLQYKGHSVTVMGVEHSEEGTPLNLLLMDPAKNGHDLRTTLQKGNPIYSRLSVSSLRGKDCQLVFASRRVMSAAERDSWKRSINCVTAAARAVQSSMARTSKSK